MVVSSSITSGATYWTGRYATYGAIYIAMLCTGVMGYTHTLCLSSPELQESSDLVPAFFTGEPQ